MDLVGTRFGMLLVTASTGRVAAMGNSVDPTWFCLCDCGQPGVEKRQSCLLYKKNHHCGCSIIRRNLIDMVGKQFDSLTVVRKAKSSRNAGASWECLCECGQVCFVRGSSLRKGQTKSCGCRGLTTSLKAGERVGNLTTIQYLGRYREVGCPEWESTNPTTHVFLFKCDCGKEVKLPGSSVRTGGVKSCGCLRTIEDRSVAAMRYLFRNYRNNAHTRGYAFELTEEQVYGLCTTDCSYCGKPPSTIVRNPARPEAFPGLFGGIDRVENDQGYIQQNCVACCWDCNQLKGTRSRSEFLALVRRIANHQARNCLLLEENIKEAHECL